PGRDLHLSTSDRALEQKDLKKIDGVHVPDSATRYRAMLAGELFDLPAEAYDNLTELLKQLRKPKLGERLNPISLADTMRAALPPLAGNEINQLADGWDRLEKLRQAVEETNSAAVQVARFVSSGWLPWAKIVVRRRAGAVTSATTELDNTTKDRRAAQQVVEDAHTEVARLDRDLAKRTESHQDRNAEL